MISMISSTSITSISGVVLMSTITSASPDPLLLPTFIDMNFSLLRRDANRRFGDEADLEYAGALTGEYHPADEFVAGVPVTANMDLGLRLLYRDLLQPVQQFLIVDRLIIPEHLSVLIDDD